MDGGASANALLMQTRRTSSASSCRGRRTWRRPRWAPPSPRGRGAGLWTEKDVFEPEGGDDRDAGGTAFEPRGGRDERERRHARWCDAVGRSLGLA